jgi:hypothetical protein
MSGILPVHTNTVSCGTGHTTASFFDFQELTGFLNSLNDEKMEVVYYHLT